MGFRVSVGEYDGHFTEYDSTERLSGPVVLGRRGKAEADIAEELVDASFEDIRDLDGVSQYELIGENPTDTGYVSKNHIVISETFDEQNREILENSPAENVSARIEGYELDVWDIDSSNGTSVGYDARDGSPVLHLNNSRNGHSIQIERITDYAVIAEHGKMLGTRNNAYGLQDEMERRNFDTSTFYSAEWSDVSSKLDEIGKKADPESRTLFIYTGHGNENGRMEYQNRFVAQRRLLDQIDRISGQKAVIFDQCHAAAGFNPDDVPENTAVFHSSGEENISVGRTTVGQETVTRYLGRILHNLKHTERECDLIDIHDRLENIERVEQHNPGREGKSFEFTSVK